MVKGKDALSILRTCAQRLTTFTWMITYHNPMMSPPTQEHVSNSSAILDSLLCPGLPVQVLASPFLSSTEVPLNTSVPRGSPMTLTKTFSLLPWMWPRLQGLHFHPPQSCPQGTF